MLVEKLWNNEITVDIVKKMIYASIKTYKSKLKMDLTISDNRNSLLAFISDDIYEFDCISRFSRLMIELGGNQNNWKQILDMIHQYNNHIMNNENIYKILTTLIQYYQKTSDEYKFINKIINSSHKAGITMHDQRFKEINNKIDLIQSKLISDFTKNIPTIVLNQSEIIGIPSEFIEKYFNSSTKNYEIHLDRQTYNLFHKFINNSNIRKKIDDMICQSYKNNIPKLVYLFIYKHVKANMLGFESYINYLTPYSSNTIKNIIENIIIELEKRCDLEIDILSQMKMKYENNNVLNSWDIVHYINKWKMLYGVIENDIMPYFELNHTVSQIMLIMSKLFSIQFIKKNKPEQHAILLQNMDVYRIVQNNQQIGELVLDLFSNPNKNTGVQTVCINNKCLYPNEKNNKTVLSIILCMNLNKKEPTLLTLTDLTTLFNEFGKVIYFISNFSRFNLFGGMYSNIEVVDTIGKFIELIFFNKSTLMEISKHYQTGIQITEFLIDKIINHRKLDYGIAYKYQCLYSLYDLYVHSNEDFINDCKEIMKLKDINMQRENMFSFMSEIYNTFYNEIFNNGNNKIMKDKNHFHPILWTYLFNGCENIHFLKILSDIHAHELFKIYSETNNKINFLQKLMDFLSKSTTTEIINIEEFTKRHISSSHMLDYFGLKHDDTLLSLYNVNSPKKNIDNINNSLYLSSEIPTQFDNYDLMSENDPMMKKMLGRIMMK
jgi:oligopeptidase A